MKTVRYGIIGAGVIANYMVPAFTEGQGAVAVAVADVNTEAAQKIATATGATRIYADYQQLLTDSEVDAVYLATPPFLHRPMTLAALGAGKHVCCEKPFALTQAEVREILAVQQTLPHLKLTCNSSRFYNSGTARRAKAMIAAGELGDVYRVHFEHITGASKPGTKLPAWRNEPAKNGGGISFDWGPYDLDWLSFVLGDLFRPQIVFGTLGNYFPLTTERVPPCLDVDGRLCAEIICAKGLAIHWERRAAEHGPDRHNVEIRGHKAGLDLTLVPMGQKQQLHHYAYVGAEELKETKLPDKIPNWNDTMVYSIRDLTAAILNNTKPSHTLENDLRIHGVLDALQASARTQKAIPIQP
ncbi:MAG: Gfo/Idh/MocA family oxidoreductase [Verrucomicrobiota bacterium]